MDDTIEPMLVEVRAATQGFASDIAQMRGNFDATLLTGFEQAGGVLERGLLGAIRKGRLGFEELGRIALNVLDQIAAQALKAGLGSLAGGGAQGGAGAAGGLLGSLLGGLLGLPGRATGGPVSPGQGYLVGERGPELFVPTASGRVEPLPSAGMAARDVRVSIALATERGAQAPRALQRSARQVASTVRRALADS